MVAATNENGSAIEEARRAGFDIDLIDSNLALSPEERVLRLASALELAQALREAGAAHARFASGASHDSQTSFVS